jgi:hypothetical protein
VVEARRRVKPRIVKVSAPAPQAEPAVAVPNPVPVSPPAPAPVPYMIVPAAPAPADSASSDIRQAALAIAPTGQGNPEAVTCRVPQALPGSRLPGPQVCKTNQVWAALRARGEEISADGHTTYLADQIQRRRLLAANCSGIIVGGSATTLLALPSNFCS